MSLYGTYIEESAPEVEKTITIEEYSELVNRAMDFLFEADEELISESELLLIEGKMDNAKIAGKYMELKKKYKVEISYFKKLYKIAKKTRSEEDIKKAKDSVDNLIKLLEDYRDEIKSIDAGSTSNIVIGFLLNQLQNILALLPAVIGPKIVCDMADGPKIFVDFTKILAAFSHVSTTISQIEDAFKRYKKTDKTDSKQLNVYRNKIVESINRYIMQVKAMKSCLDKLKN